MSIVMYRRLRFNSAQRKSSQGVQAVDLILWRHAELKTVQSTATATVDTDRSSSGESALRALPGWTGSCLTGEHGSAPPAVASNSTGAGAQVRVRAEFLAPDAIASRTG
jgi:hypothetical protein